MTFLTNVYRIYQVAYKVLDIYEYAKIGISILQALFGGSFAGAVQRVTQTIASELTPTNIFDIENGFSEMISALASQWDDISDAVIARADDIALQAAAYSATRLPAYIKAEAEGRLKIVLFLPSGPGGSPSNKYVNVTKDFQIAFSARGGRLFGLGVRTSKANVDQTFRIDYWDVRDPPSRPTPTPIHVHWHIGGDSHPPNRTIYPN